MTTIAITGVAGRLGHRLVRSLQPRSDVTRIIGFDRRAPQGLGSSRFVFQQTDVRTPEVAAALRGVDVLIHLAVQVDPIRDEDRMHAVNVDGTRNVIEAAERAGVAQVICLSSVAAYGAFSDNDLPLTEDSPLRGTPGFNYSTHMHDIERWLASWTAEDRRTDVCILRPAVTLGPGVQNFVTRLLEGPRFATVRGHTPPLQVVHLDDVVTAIEHAMDHRLTGAYNVCAEGWLSYDEVLDLVDRRCVSVPEELAYSIVDRLWKLGVGDFPPGVIQHLMHPCVMSPAKLVATGWRPTVSNRTALAETVREHADHVALAGVRMRRSTVWSVLGATGVAALGAAVWVVRAFRRRRAAAHEGRADRSRTSGSGGR